ncbi:FecR family protein [Tenacibaculum insulae]|uniref:FecR family protein n=1 Tax=Tenacibaculum insulae TaxID=2029677 RepID=UPI003AB7CAAA
MKNKFTEDTFLARWVANDLSPDELKQFEESDDFHQFKKINDAAQQLKAPDFNKTDSFTKISKKLTKKKATLKVIKLAPKWMYSAAASVILLLTVFFLNNNDNSVANFSTKYGEQTTVKLPDNSIVQLSADANLKFNKENWDNNRLVTLSGKAYFEVEKGSSFTVSTNEGNVTVLGTKFTVNASKNFFEVQCFEGKVKAISKNKNEIILTKGKAFRVYKNTSENWIFSSENPSWINGESTFNNTPLSNVILTLEKQYNLNINTNKIDTTKRFTGAFTHNDVNIALKTVFAPMKISFKLAENSSVILTPN